MGHTRYEPAYDGRRAWNAGRMVGAKKALKPKGVWAIRFFLEREGRFRDRAMFDLAIDSKLRGCDVVKVKIVWLQTDRSAIEPWSLNKRPVDPCSLI